MSLKSVADKLKNQAKGNTLNDSIRESNKNSIGNRLIREIAFVPQSIRALKPSSIIGTLAREAGVLELIDMFRGNEVKAQPKTKESTSLNNIKEELEKINVSILMAVGLFANSKNVLGAIYRQLDRLNKNVKTSVSNTPNTQTTMTDILKKSVNSIILPSGSIQNTGQERDSKGRFLPKSDRGKFKFNDESTSSPNINSGISKLIDIETLIYKEVKKISVIMEEYDRETDDAQANTLNAFKQREATKNNELNIVPTRSTEEIVKSEENSIFETIKKSIPAFLSGVLATLGTGTAMNILRTAGITLISGIAGIVTSPLILSTLAAGVAIGAGIYFKDQIAESIKNALNYFKNDKTPSQTMEEFKKTIEERYKPNITEDRTDRSKTSDIGSLTPSFNIDDIQKTIDQGTTNKPSSWIKDAVKVMSNPIDNSYKEGDKLLVKSTIIGIGKNGGSAPRGDLVTVLKNLGNGRYKLQNSNGEEFEWFYDPTSLYKMTKADLEMIKAKARAKEALFPETPSSVVPKNNGKIDQVIKETPKSVNKPVQMSPVIIDNKKIDNSVVNSGSKGSAPKMGTSPSGFEFNRGYQ